MKEKKKRALIQWGFFLFLWIIFPFLEFGYISLGLPILSEEVSIPVSEISHYSYPKVGDTITDGVLWAIFTASGLLIHVCLRLSTPAEYTMGTLEFCRIFGTIPPVVSILTSCVKFSACEPRPNFLARCLFDQNDVVKTDISAYANHMLGTTFNIKDCPNTDRITVINGLLSMPSGHASQSFAIFTFLYRLISSIVVTDLHPYIVSFMYVFPIICSCSRISDHQHHLVDVVIGTFLGVAIGNLIFKTMISKSESLKKKVQPMAAKKEAA